MPKISLSKRAIKFLRNIPLKHAKQIDRKLQELEKDPYPHDSKLLKNSDYHRVDIGEYRAIYRVEDDKTLLLAALIGKRNDDEVYRQFFRIS